VTEAGHRDRWLHPTLSQVITDDSHRSSPISLQLINLPTSPGSSIFLVHLAREVITVGVLKKNAFIKLNNGYNNKRIYAINGNAEKHLINLKPTRIHACKMCTCMYGWHLAMPDIFQPSLWRPHRIAMHRSPPPPF
jgi:hypothetical protein